MGHPDPVPDGKSEVARRHRTGVFGHLDRVSLVLRFYRRLSLGVRADLMVSEAERAERWARIELGEEGYRHSPQRGGPYPPAWRDANEDRTHLVTGRNTWLKMPVEELRAVAEVVGRSGDTDTAAILRRDADRLIVAGKWSMGNGFYTAHPQRARDAILGGGTK